MKKPCEECELIPCRAFWMVGDGGLEPSASAM